MLRFILTALLLVSCGRYQPTETPEIEDCPIPVDVSKKVIVAVFGAPWCSACKNQIPELDKALLKLGAINEKIEFRFYVTTGTNSAVAPTQDIADRYRDSLHISASSNIDPWKWKYFRAWVGGELLLPGAAILSHDQKVIKQFRGGFNPSEVAFAAKTIVLNKKE